jgi:hypothetical protein
MVGACRPVAAVAVKRANDRFNQMRLHYTKMRLDQSDECYLAKTSSSYKHGGPFIGKKQSSPPSQGRLEISAQD